MKSDLTDNANNSSSTWTRITESSNVYE